MAEDKRQWTLEHPTKAKARTEDTKEKGKETRVKEKATANKATVYTKEKESKEENNSINGKDKDTQLDKEKDNRTISTKETKGKEKARLKENKWPTHATGVDSQDTMRAIAECQSTT